MFSHELSKALFEIEDLKARLATAEAELDATEADAARWKSNADSIWMAGEENRKQSNAEILKLRTERDAARAKLEEIGMMICCVNDFEKFDPVQLVRDQLEILRGELTSAQSGEARAVAGLGTLNHAAKVAISTHYGNSEDEDTPLTIRLLDGTCDATDELLSAAQPALDWLAQQRAEAAEAERNANTDVIRSLGPAFCDFFFGGPGEAEYLAGVLRAQRAEAAAEAIKAFTLKAVAQIKERPDRGQIDTLTNVFLLATKTVAEIHAEQMVIGPEA
jgi:hypothetical protein